MANNTGTQAQQDVDSKDISRILEEHRKDSGGLIAILEEIQDEYVYLPQNALRILSD